MKESTKYGWWQVQFTITLDGEEVFFSDLSDDTQEHIAQAIVEGCRQGQVCESYEYYDCEQCDTPTNETPVNSDSVHMTGVPT